MNVIEGTGEIVVEPDWRRLLSRKAEREAAAEYWRAITAEMRSRNILSAGNQHAIQRLVIGYVIYDRSARDSIKTGAVVMPKADNARGIPRINPAFRVMKEASAYSLGLEAELGLAPRRRSSATKVARPPRPQGPSTSYLKPKD